MPANFKTFSAFLMVGIVFYLISCSDNNETGNAQDTADVISESIADSYFQDTDDFVRFTAENVSPSKGGKVAADGRLVCATITWVVANDSTVNGEITIDFGTGCTDPKGNVRKGKVIIAYTNGPAGNIGFKTVTTFVGYSINGLALEGTRTVVRVTPVLDPANIRHDITLVNGKITWPDATFASRASSFSREINVSTGVITLEGAANGINRKGVDYTVEITKALVYKVSCAIADGIYMPVEGTKVIVANSRTLTIDYGAGTCDKVVTLTVGNFTKEVTVNG